MKFRMIVIGRDRGDPLCEIAAEYIERIGHYYPIELVELKEEPAKGGAIDHIRAVEAERIDKALRPGERRIALDETGKALSSKALAQKIERWSVEGVRVSLIIGGPNGLDRGFLARADERWSLSQMTLPHRLARVVLAEQIYRACTIIRGEPYHK